MSAKIESTDGEIVELTKDELNKDLPSEAPKDFKPWEIDYKQPEDQLKANYRMAFIYTKDQCNWTQMDYKINGGKNITINRLDIRKINFFNISNPDYSLNGNKKNHLETGGSILPLKRAV